MKVSRGYRYADFDGLRILRVDAYDAGDDSRSLVQSDDAGTIRVLAVEALKLHRRRTDGYACQGDEPAGALHPGPLHVRVMTFRAQRTGRNERGPAAAARRPHQFFLAEERFEPVIADRLRRQFLSPFQDRKRACAAGAAEVVRRAQAQVPVRNLPRAGLLPQLFPYLDQLRDARRPHGMPLAFQPAGGVDRLRTVQPRRALASGPASLTRTEEAEVLDVQDFRDGKAVVYLGELYVLGAEVRHCIGFPGRLARGLEARQFRRGVQPSPAALAEAHHIKGIVGKLPGHLFTHKQNTAGAVADGTAIEEMHRPGHRWVGTGVAQEVLFIHPSRDRVAARFRARYLRFHYLGD